MAFDLHYRYQRVSPECPPPLSSVKKSGLKSTLTSSMCKEEGGSCSNNGNIENGRKDIGSAFEGAKAVKYRSPSRNQDHHHNSTLSHSISGNGFLDSPPKGQGQSESNHQHHHHTHHETPKRSETSSPNRGDVLLQWGQKKRARVSRSEIRPLADDSSSSSVAGRQNMGNKIQRRVLHATMPPPPPPAPHPARCSTLRNGLLSSSGSPSRNSSGTSRAASRSMAGKRSPPLETIDRKKCVVGSVKEEKLNGSSSALQTDRLNHTDSAPVQSEQAAAATVTAPAVDKVNNEVIEWPRIYLSLSRKEKEDDFLAMKGTKLPQRPKKRAKNVDRALQYCFPGMWLSDLTKSRYEVREKKSVKKQKRRGLKGMESVESESE
ncbi:hypothetical protein CCACVL1_19760 [Corchorus capsularis]|uniref:Uncharacterized protein n=1 Tax=Corchorus capsularis TaxID=210143 RepID=A0A1R3HF36_COCAP|nr:hypothetical protein CCACVL1_19760 [Corchorus capsularis]